MTDGRPTKWAIVQYWAGSPSGHEVFAPRLSIDDPCCFACGWFSERWKEGRSARKSWERARLERAHIIPAGLDGSDEAANLILLCTPCHEESPDWFSPWEMAAWISRRPERPSREVEQMNAWLEALEDVPQFKEMLNEQVTSKGSVEVVVAALRKSLDGAVVHGNGVGLTRATMAAIVRRSVAEVRGDAHLQRIPISRAGRRSRRPSGEVTV